MWIMLGYKTHCFQSKPVIPGVYNPPFSFKHSTSFLPWHLRSRAHPSLPESLKGTTSHGTDLLCSNVCLGAVCWRVCVDLPATCEVKLEGGFSKQSKSCDSFRSLFSLFMLFGWMMLLLLHCTKWGSNNKWADSRLKNSKIYLQWRLANGTFWHSHNVKKIWS